MDRHKRVRAVVLSGLVLACLAACRGEQTPAPQAPPTAAPAPINEPLEVPEGADVALNDVIETTAQSVVGISFPNSVGRYPGLARALQVYADAARAELQQAVSALGNDKPRMPYELSLSFERVLETPQLVVVTADGSRYTGGAHGEPLLARFVWLPDKRRMLTSDTLIASNQGWEAVSQYVRDELREKVATRLSGEDLPPAQLQQSLRDAARMIESGTEPGPQNFSQFQPLVSSDGKITALRFVFAPYQVGPYSDGTQVVDVPTAVVLPHVVPEYAELFEQ